MKKRLEDTQLRAHGRLEHVNVTTFYGDAVCHCRRRGGEANVGGDTHDLDWWRTPNPRKGLLHPLLDLLKGQRVRR